MNFQAPKFSKKSITVFITLGAIGLAYAFYFFVYVDNNERVFNQKVFRNLKQIGENLQEKQKVHILNVRSIGQLNIKFGFENDLIISYLNDEIKNLEEKEESYSQNNALPENPEYIPQKELSYLKRNRADLYDKSFKDQLIKYSTNKGFKFIDNKKESRKIDFQKYDYKNIYYEYLKESTIKGKSSGGEHLIFNYSLEKFVKPIFKRDVIDEFLLKRKGDLGFTYQTFDNKVHLKYIDTLSLNSINPKKSKIHNIIVQGISYKMFTYHFNFDNNESWLLIGCVKTSNYIEQTRSVNLWIVINIFLLVILLMVSMPLLKLVMMNTIERLNQSNVFFSGLSIVLGAPLLILFLLIFHSYFHNEFSKTDQDLRGLSDDILVNFTDEVKYYHSILKEFEESTFSTADSFSKFSKGKNIYKIPREDVLSKASLKDLKNFNEVFWMDAKGDQTIVIRKGKENNNVFNLVMNKAGAVVLKNRAYFNQVKLGKLWNFPNPEDKLFMQSIVSWSTGEPEIAISKNLTHNPNSNTVIAITSKFQSIMNTVLPKGYGFCMIDSNGKVQFHSDFTKNLQENFLLEADDDNNLVSSIYAKIENFSTIDYLEKKQRTYIKPVEGTPFYLVVFYDLENLKARGSEIWSVSLIIFLCSFLTVGFMILILYLINIKTSKLLVKKFFFSWMAPKLRHFDLYIKLRKIYSRSTIVIIALIIVLKQTDNRWFVDLDPSYSFFFIFILPLICFMLTHNELKQASEKEIVIESLFLILANFAYFSTLTNLDFTPIIGIIFIQLIILFAFPFDFKKLFSSNDRSKIEKPKLLNNRYSLFLLSWLILSSILPILLIYIIYYDIESNIWTKHRLLDLTEKIDKNESLSFESDFKNSPNLYCEFLVMEKETISNTVKIDPSPFELVLYGLRPGYRNSIIQNRGLIHLNSKLTEPNENKKPIKDKQITFYNSDNKIVSKYRNLNGDYLYLSQPKNTFKLFDVKDDHSWFLLLTVILFLFILYKIIYFSTNKIYGLHFSNHKFYLSHDLRLKELKKVLESRNIAIIGLPGSSKLSFLKGANLLTSGANKSKDTDELLKKLNHSKIIDCRGCNYADLIKKIRDAINGASITLKDNTTLTIKKDEILILDNFEYNNSSNKINCLKLKLIEELQKKRMRIIIASELHPNEVIDYHYRNIIDSSTANITNENEQIYENMKENWRHVFSNFMLIYIPFYKGDFSVTDDIYSKEMQHGKYLQHIHNLIPKENIYDKEDKILEIQQYANSYYYALWNALTRREKFAVYDMADDEFINTGNIQIVKTLLNKGIIVFDNKLKLMNKSFANFVLTIVKDGEVIEMNKEVRKKGKWANIKLVIILVLVALITLIGFGQPDFFKNVNAIAIAIVGVASILPSLSGLMAFSKKIK